MQAEGSYLSVSSTNISKSMKRQAMMTATVTARITATAAVGGINTLTTGGFHEISGAVLGQLFTK